MPHPPHKRGRLPQYRLRAHERRKWTRNHFLFFISEVNSMRCVRRVDVWWNSKIVCARCSTHPLPRLPVRVRLCLGLRPQPPTRVRPWSDCQATLPDATVRPLRARVTATILPRLLLARPLKSILTTHNLSIWVFQESGCGFKNGFKRKRI
jgi:hypothetical protein